MAEDRSSIDGGKLLITAAALVVVVAGLKAAAVVLLPFLVAVFLSILAIPPMRSLTRRGVPSWLAIVIVVTVATILVVSVTVYVGASLATFQQNLGLYKAELNRILGDGLTWLTTTGLVEHDQAPLAEVIGTNQVMQFATNAAAGLLAAMSNLLVVVLTLIFMLFEATSFRSKLVRVYDDPHADLSTFTAAANSVHDYLIVKAGISLVTGVLVALLNFALGVDFPIMWGLVAFLFNFVPNIGSLIAAIPAVLLALVEFGGAKAGVVGLGYLVINMTLGNFIEPRLMGRRLGLSTLVVWLSLVFWGWIWGPTGMLLAVPLTVMLKIALEHTDDFRWVAILLGPADEPASGRLRS